MTRQTSTKAVLSILAFAGVSLFATGCTTTDTATADGPQVIGVAKQTNQTREWGGLAGFLQGGMTIDKEPEAIAIDPRVDYVDYGRGIVRYGIGNTETFVAPDSEEEVEFQKIGFD